MLILSLLNTLYFKGVNIIDFLETFIELYKDYNIKKEDLKTKLIRYYNIT